MSRQARRPDLVGETGEAAAQLAEPPGQIAGRAALVDVRVPAADVDEAEVEAVAHQRADAASRELEAFRRGRAAVRLRHLGGDALVDFVLDLEALVNRRRQRRAAVHVLDQRRLAGVDSRPADVGDADVGDGRRAAERRAAAGR